MGGDFDLLDLCTSVLEQIPHFRHITMVVYSQILQKLYKSDLKLVEVLPMAQKF
jgi:hypothetical protein